MAFVYSEEAEELVGQGPMLKVWFGRVWFGYGRQSKPTRRIERTWLASVLPPYYEGSGVALRLPGGRSVRLGVCRAKLSTVDGDYDMVDIEEELVASVWTDAPSTTEEIRSWTWTQTAEGETWPSGASVTPE